ncbi:hypothetical protein MMPV_005048 [Pyropia vietnamensis]
MAAPPVDLSTPSIRRPMGGTERFMYIAEQVHGGTMRIAAVVTLASAAPLTAATITAAVHAVAARHDALRTVVVGGDTFVAAPPSARLAVDVTVVEADAAVAGGGLARPTAAAFARAKAVLAAGLDGPWANPPSAPAAAAAVPDHLPWRAAVYLPPPGARVDPADAAAVVWYLPHYLADGTSVDALAAATIDALAFQSAGACGGAGGVRASPSPLPPPVVPLAPPLGEVYPPPGGALLGTALGIGLFLGGELAAPWTQRHRRGLAPPPPGPRATAATRSCSAHDAIVPAAAVQRFAAAAKAAGTTVGCGLVAALALALDAAGVVAPAPPGRRPSTIAVDVPINARVGAPSEKGLESTTVGCYVGSAVVDVPVGVGGNHDGEGEGAGGGDRPGLWALASSVHATVHSPGYRKAEAERFGVLGTLLSSFFGRGMLHAAVTSPRQQGRVMPPAVSNVGRCGLTDAANARAAAAATAAAANGAAGASPVSASAIRLMDYEAALGAPLILYACSVGGDMCLVLTSVQPLVSVAAAEKLLALVVQHIESA